jgi:uncharacterized protein
MTMIEIEDLSDREIAELLARVGYGHLACCLNDKPYVVPVHYAYKSGVIYIYTTEGKKFEIIKQNPNVCLQIEEVADNRHWISVIVDGKAKQLQIGPEREEALEHITETNPTLTPAVSVRWMDSWVRENIEVIYRLDIETTTGRRAVDRSGDDAFVPRGPATPA